MPTTPICGVYEELPVRYVAIIRLEMASASPRGT